ncbi:MAG: DNA polymerase/3'-5' exonuclease PolX [Planctomycetaceae bacterium]|nr:DNA polymerase/3'-5' exonuclease PolX [Planctomycetaceae bacterium]
MPSAETRTNSEVAAAFEELTVLSEILGANVFKVNAFRRAARAVEGLAGEACAMEVAVLKEIDGLGASTAAKIHEFAEKGTMSELEELRAQVPAGLKEVLAIQGIGPKTARAMWTELGIVDLASLKAAIDAGKVATLPRMGAKTIQNMKDAIAFAESARGRIRIGEAMPLADALVVELGKISGVERVAYAGSLRRGRETIGDLDILASACEPAKLMEAFCARADVARVLGHGDTKSSVLTKSGVQVDLRVVPLDRFGAALMYFTGSKDHNIRMRERAIAQGMRLNEYGLFRAGPEGEVPAGAEPVAAASEDDVYAALGLAWIPPTAREDRGELERFAKGIVRDPVAAVVDISDIRAELHCHTRASDGAMTIDEIVAEAERRGFHTIAITDHSKSQFQANGLDEARLREHIRAIHAARARFPRMQIWAGSEVDILADGSLDYADDLLAELDWVVASPHAALKQEPRVATERLLKAIAHPLVHVIGHPTGRIVNGRPGLEPAMSELYAAAKEHGTALELNSHHVRLDLRDTHVRAAAEAGCMVAIDCDVHGLGDFEELRYGMLTAQRGLLPRAQCLNALDPKALDAWRRRKR